MNLTGSIKDGVVFPGIDLENMPDADMTDMRKWEIPTGVSADNRSRGHALLLKIPENELSKGGIYQLAPGADQTKGQEICWVMMVCRDPDVDVRPGDIIICTGHSFTELPFVTKNLRKQSPENTMKFGAVEANPSCILMVQRGGRPKRVARGDMSASIRGMIQDGCPEGNA